MSSKGPYGVEPQQIRCRFRSGIEKAYLRSQSSPPFLTHVLETTKTGHPRIIIGDVGFLLRKYEGSLPNEKGTGIGKWKRK